ncbi:MAG: hypothetical protein JWO67_2499 [Streptosporangiaceae bacterium]|jgi:hypothetical protein|nr:hypothetical protein [Streptosporangiaceae bacterium]
MPSNRVDNTQQGNVVSGAASPVTITLPPHSTPVTLVITSASAITVSGVTGPGHAVDINHTP